MRPSPDNGKGDRTQTVYVRQSALEAGAVMCSICRQEFQQLEYNRDSEMSNVSVVGVVILTVTAQAGDISGIVKHRRTGSPTVGVKVAGLTSGLLGGMTGSVRTDDRE